MSFSDIIQLITTIFVGLALALGLWQGRQMLKQTIASSGQLFNEVNYSLAQAHTNLRVVFFQNDPELLAWYLESRGYGSSTPFENRKKLYALVKLDTHEEIHLGHRRGLLTEPMWRGWLQVLRTDLSVPVFADVWENGAKFYEASFQEVVNSNFPSSNT
jgi:hypothetical protein